MAIDFGRNRKARSVLGAVLMMNSSIALLNSKGQALPLLVCFAVASCTMERFARLYPANDVAGEFGIIEVRFIASGIGNGAVDMTAPDGETFKGEYSIVRHGASGFGTIFGSVYSGGYGVFGSAYGSQSIAERGSKGIASAFGSRGTRVECEFLNDNMSGSGYHSAAWAGHSSPPSPSIPFRNRR